jgi:hypothetical protein
MHEQLLGYLLNALDHDERREVEQMLASSAALRAELEALRRDLLKLEVASEVFEPPASLTERTCDVIFQNNWLPEAGPAPNAETPAFDIYDHDDPGLLEADEFARCWSLEPEDLPSDAARPAGAFDVNWRTPEAPAASRGRRDAPQPGPAPTSHWSLADFVVAGGVFLAAALLFFPAIANSRIQSDVLTCQRNLWRIHNGITHYSEAHQGLMPAIPVTGNFAVAGVYAPILAHNQYIEDPEVLLCPSSPWSQPGSDWWLPTFAEIERARGEALLLMQQRMGGSYDYTLGYIADGRYHSTRYLGRSSFAILGDAAGADPAGFGLNHGKAGCNLLFEDGSVRLVVKADYMTLPDNPFFNRHGQKSAGLGASDAVLGGSATPPLGAQLISWPD